MRSLRRGASGAGIVLAALLLALTPVLIESGWAQETGKTVQNLLTSLKNELTARSRYIAYAEKADAEGYKQVASLFRAQARAEEVHAERFQSVLKKLNVTPPMEYELPMAADTKTNLAAVIDIERQERDGIYPQFIQEAMAENQREAVQAFELAKSTEVEHFNLCNEASQKLDEMKSAHDYYVCGVCGFTTPYLVFAKCPACSAGRSKFESVR